MPASSGYFSRSPLTSVPPELPATNAFLLDIDVSEETDLPINFEQLVEKLEQMRNLKNDVFEASITSLARKSFE